VTLLLHHYWGSYFSKHYCLWAKGRVSESIYCANETFKQFIYFQRHMFIMHRVMTGTRECLISADDGGASGLQADGKGVRRFRSSTKTL